MYFGVPGPAEMLILLAMLGGGAGLPLGVPPAAEDPMMAQVAPDECILYLTWSGIAEPDPDSSNQTEQLLAEPEVRHMIDEIVRRIKTGLRDAAKKEDPDAVPIVEDASNWVQTLLTHPTAIFVSKFEMSDEGPPVIRGGAVVAVGEGAAELKTKLKAYQQMFLKGAAKEVLIGGDTWYRLKLDPDAPEITWGTKDKYFIVGVGEGAIEAILERTATRPPEWLTDLRKQLPVDRVSTVSYANVKTLIDPVARMFGVSQTKAILDATGLGDVTSFSSVTGLDKEGFVSRTLVGLADEPRGLLASLVAKPLSAADLKPIPRDATIAMAARADLGVIYESILAMVEKVEPRAHKEILQGIGEAEELLGYSLRNDVLKSIGDVWCVYNSPGEGGLVFTGLTAVVPVENHKTLSAVHKKLLTLARDTLKHDEERMQRVSREHDIRPRAASRIEQLDYAGRQVYFLNMRGNPVPFAPAWCLTEKELIVALFPQNVKAYLSRGKEAGSIADVPQVAKLLAGDNGPLALSYIDTPKLFELIYPFVPMFGQMIAGELQREGIDVDISILPSAKSIGKHLRPSVTAVRRNEAGIEIVSHQSLPGGGLLGSPLMMLPRMMFGMARSSAPMVREVFPEEAMPVESAEEIEEFEEEGRIVPVPR